MKSRRRRMKHHEESENFWPAFTDMITTVVLILFFLVMLFFIKDIVSAQAKKELSEQLAAISAELDDRKKLLDETENNLANSQLELEDREQELTTLLDELQAGRNELKLAEQAIDDQRSIIEESNAELSNLRSKLEGIALLRVDVLNKVKLSIEAELGATNASGEEIVRIGDNGNIIINESLVFDTSSYDIKSDGQELLEKLAVAFENVLDNEDIRQNIDAISIQGHTDERSSAEYNRELSAKRAYTVVNYMMASNPSLEANYGSYFAASAYSEFRPIDTGNTQEAYAKNRRIEISVILKDSHVQNVINEYLEESLNNLDD